jgi:hypothetical protein
VATITKRFKREEPALCAYALANLRTHHIEEYRDRRLDEIAPGSVCREINLLHAVLESVRRRVGLIENPVSHERVDACRLGRVIELEAETECALAGESAVLFGHVPEHPKHVQAGAAIMGEVVVFLPMNAGHHIASASSCDRCITVDTTVQPKAVVTGFATALAPLRLRMQAQ